MTKSRFQWWHLWEMAKLSFQCEMPRVASHQFIPVACCLLASYLVIVHFFSLVIQIHSRSILYHPKWLPFTCYISVFATNCKEFERCPLNLDNKYTFALDEASKYKHEKVNNKVKKKKSWVLSFIAPFMR